MVGLVDGDEPGLFRPGRRGLPPELEGHLERRLDRRRAVVGEEHAVEPGRRDRGQAAGELDRGRIREAEIRGVGDLGRLVGQGGIEPRMSVAVHVAPHAGRTVEVPVAVGVDEPAALAPLDQERLVFLHLGEGVPDVVPIPGAEFLVRSRHGRTTRVPIRAASAASALLCTTAASITPCEPTSATSVPGGASP